MKTAIDDPSVASILKILDLELIEAEAALNDLAQKAEALEAIRLPLWFRRGRLIQAIQSIHALAGGYLSSANITYEDLRKERDSLKASLLEAEARS